MKLQITAAKKTWRVKRSFNRNFPFLKIEFFSSKHVPGQPTAAKSMINANVPLTDINPKLKEGSLIINETNTVAQIEAYFQDYGLPVQVFRKQNNVWIETTATDQLTLAEQNEKGKQASAVKARTTPVDRYLEDGQYS